MNRFGLQATDSIVYSDDNTVQDADSGSASSMHGMDHMVNTMVQQTTAPLHSADELVSLTPAELTGFADDYGSLTLGKCADILVFTETLDLQSVYLQGIRFRAERAPVCENLLSDRSVQFSYFLDQHVWQKTVSRPVC